MLQKLGIGLCVLAIAACADEQDKNQDPVGADELWDEIQMDQYRQWERAPGYDEARESNAPHGMSVEIYVNDVIAHTLAVEKNVTQWPTGSVIVKDGFDDGELKLVAVMEKRVDGWFWAEYDAQGGVDFSGRPSVCVDCHASGADAVRAFAFP